MSESKDSLEPRPTIVDLPELSLHFPLPPEHEMVRDNVLNTIENILRSPCKAMVVEGPEGSGKTTLLSQFVRRHRTSALSLFISAGNRLSFDLTLIRNDLATQAFWLSRRSPLPNDFDCSSLLNLLFGEVQRCAKHAKQLIYFVIDGIEELESSHRDKLLQQLAEVLPIGTEHFRFVFSGDASIYQPHFPKLTLKSYILTELSPEEANHIVARPEITAAEMNTITAICRGLPAHLATVRRALESGSSVHDFTSDTARRWPELFEADWERIDTSDDDLLKILSLIVHDTKPYSVDQIASVLTLPSTIVAAKISSISFLRTDPSSSAVQFVTSGLRSFVADRLSDRRIKIQKILIKRMMAAPDSDEAVLELPSWLEESGEYGALLDWIKPDHILRVLERTQTLSKVDDHVQRGFRGAKRLGRDAEMLRFGLQQSIVAEIAATNAWESEIAALASLGRDNQALALASSAILREDRLAMLATLSRGIWIRGDEVPKEHITNIQLLIQNLEPRAISRRASSIASDLTCVSPSLASEVLIKAKLAVDEASLDSAFVGLTVSALRDLKDDRRREQAMEIAARSRNNPKTRSLLEGLQALAGRADAAEVCERVARIERAEARISLLRHWCLFNGKRPNADKVAHEALRVALAATETAIDASFQADISKAIPGASTVQRKRDLIAAIDGLNGSAKRLGPSVDYVSLQLSLAEAEAEFDISKCEQRLNTTLDFIELIGDLPSKGEAYAKLFATLKNLSRNEAIPAWPEIAYHCNEELEAVVLTLAESTADHQVSLSRVISSLARGDVEKAIEFTRIVNTEHRRNAVLLEVIDTLLRQSVLDIRPIDLQLVFNSITGNDERDEALLSILERFADVSDLRESQARELLPLVDLIGAISNSMIACRAIVCALKLLRSSALLGQCNELVNSLSDLLMKRWSCIDVAWLKIDVGYEIVQELASNCSQQAEAMMQATDELKSQSHMSAPRPAAAFVACIHLVGRAFCGLLPRSLEAEDDFAAIAALIEMIPSYGERTALWAQISMRAAIAGRTDVAERLVKDYLLPALDFIPKEDVSYRTSVLILTAPALYKAQPATCLERLKDLPRDDRDMALRDIIRFLLFNRVPSDPVERTGPSAATVSHETLLQVENLTNLLSTDWMIFATAQDIAELITSQNKRNLLNTPQREDLARRFKNIARLKLPMKHQISHPGFQIATLAQVFRFVDHPKLEWSSLISEAEGLSNIADRVYVFQIIALALPNKLSAQRTKLLEAARQQIKQIPCDVDQIERFLGLAEELHGVDSQATRDLVNRAAKVISESLEDMRGLQRRLVDVAYRVDADLARRLIDAFDDDAAKQRAQSQVRLLEVRNAIAQNKGLLDQPEVGGEMKPADVSRLGALLLRSLNAGRVQNFHPSTIRRYLDMAAEQPLRDAFALLSWYVENAVSRFAKTPQASGFLRPIFDSCVVGAQLAGQVSGSAMVRLSAARNQSSQLTVGRSLLSKPGDREEAFRVLTAWLERNIQDTAIFHDPYFTLDDLNWLQMLRSARPDCKITIITSKKAQPRPVDGEELSDLYGDAWRKAYDQQPPHAEIAVIGCGKVGISPIHDRWLVSGTTGLRFGTSVNALGSTRDSEISEMTPEDAAQCALRMKAYLDRELTEHRGERISLSRFWL